MQPGGVVSTPTPEGEARAAPASEEWGARLRDFRVRHGWSLQDVELMTSGEFKTSVLSAYEREERVISVPRLARLAHFYGVPAASILVGELIDLPSLEAAEQTSAADPTLDVLVRYSVYIRVRRGEKVVGPLRVRATDLEFLSVLLGRTREDTIALLGRLGLHAETARGRGRFPDPVSGAGPGPG